MVFRVGGAAFVGVGGDLDGVIRNYISLKPVSGPYRSIKCGACHNYLTYEVDLAVGMSSAGSVCKVRGSPVSDSVRVLLQQSNQYDIFPL